MILFTILTLILLILLVVIVVTVSAFGAGFIIIFGDVIVCMFLIGLALKLICFRKKEIPKKK